MNNTHSQKIVEISKEINKINKEKKELEQKINELEKELQNKDMLINDIKSKKKSINNELRRSVNIIKNFKRI